KAHFPTRDYEEYALRSIRMSNLLSNPQDNDSPASPLLEQQRLPLSSLFARLRRMLWLKQFTLGFLLGFVLITLALPILAVAAYFESIIVEKVVIYGIIACSLIGGIVATVKQTSRWSGIGFLLGFLIILLRMGFFLTL